MDQSDFPSQETTDPPAPTLTDRERQLILLALGDSFMPRMAAMMDLTKSEFMTTLEGLRRKLVAAGPRRDASRTLPTPAAPSP